MVCIYCQSDTQVINSRPQKRSNSVWRRRQCEGCNTVFSTEEHADLTKSVVVRKSPKRLEAFQNDRLFIDLYESLKHRKTALKDARALTSTIISKVLMLQVDGIIEKNDITRCTYEILGYFDNAAAVHYRAFYPLVDLDV